MARMCNVTLDGTTIHVGENRFFEAMKEVYGWTPEQDARQREVDRYLEEVFFEEVREEYEKGHIRRNEVMKK